MNLIVKTKGSQPISDKDRAWARTKFLKLKKLIPGETIIEVTLEDLYGPKGGRDKKVHVLTELPKSKQPFHLEEVDSNLRRAVTTARDRFWRYLVRYREQHSEHLGRRRKRDIILGLFRRLRRRDQREGQQR